MNQLHRFGKLHWFDSNTTLSHNSTRTVVPSVIQPRDVSRILGNNTHHHHHQGYHLSTVQSSNFVGCNSIVHHKIFKSSLLSYKYEYHHSIHSIASHRAPTCTSLAHHFQSSSCRTTYPYSSSSNSSAVLHISTVVRHNSKRVKAFHIKTSLLHTKLLHILHSTHTTLHPLSCHTHGHLHTSTSSSQTHSHSHSHYTEPTPANKNIGNWLLFISGTIFCMVVLGGVTRLTRSGLSITEWKLHDIRLPFTRDEWLLEFQKYKDYPEYQYINHDMSLDEFKTIYLYEYTHRLLGRTIGVMFFVPLCYFLYKRQINRSLALQLSTIFALGGLQGVIGWWMVKSGLSDWGYQQQYGVNQTPRVSPYRLCIHLISAFVIYIMILRLGLKLRFPLNPNALNISSFPSLKLHHTLRSYTFAASVLTFITVISGAFVAGNHAGLIYNEFPLMGHSIIPPTQELWLNELQPLWRNIFENSTLVQFNHRMLAVTTASSITVLWLLTKTKKYASMLSKNTKLWYNTLALVTAGQVSLGIATLLNHVPISLAALHQAGSLTLLTTAVCTFHSLGKLQLTAVTTSSSDNTLAANPHHRSTRTISPTNTVVTHHTGSATASLQSQPSRAMNTMMRHTMVKPHAIQYRTTSMLTQAHTKHALYATFSSSSSTSLRSESEQKQKTKVSNEPIDFESGSTSSSSSNLSNHDNKQHEQAQEQRSTESKEKGIPNIALIVFSLLLAYNVLRPSETAEERERKRLVKGGR